MLTQLSSGPFIALHLRRCSIVAELKFVVEIIIEIHFMSKRDLKMCASPIDADAMLLLFACLLNHHSSIVMAYDNVIAVILNLSISAREVRCSCALHLRLLIVALRLISPVVVT
ncbi:hypothetical protein GW17_00012861 [Ensete ventricosum]|nr:hypothetical protein GW17_00012861 [Ensete ventricosum]